MYDSNLEWKEILCKFLMFASVLQGELIIAMTTFVKFSLKTAWGIFETPWM